MKTSLLFAAVAGMTLVSAAPPADPIPWEDEQSLSEYPACSRTVTDRCIQTNERGGEAPANMARNEDLGDEGGAPMAGPEPMGSSYAASDYPPCSATLTDRCTQTGARGSRAATRMARSAPKRAHRQERMQLAMRAGERG